jgi:hypothetical protein
MTPMRVLGRSPTDVKTRPRLWSASGIESQAARSVALPVASTYVGAALYLLAPHHNRFPAVMATLLVFGLMPALLWRVRPIRDTVICPLNWTLLLFFLQLVVAPLMVCYFGPYGFTLPALPSDRAINIALLITCLGFASFCLGYHLFEDRASRMTAARLPGRKPWNFPTKRVVVAFALVGLMGLVITFQSPGALLHYFTNPAGSVGYDFNAGAGSARQVAGNLLRPFLGFACILSWCAWIRVNRERPPWQLGLATALAGLAILLAFATSGYNRGSVVVPLVALAAVYGASVGRLSLRWVMPMALVALVLLTGFRAYRNSSLTLDGLLTNSQTRSTLVKQADIDYELQVYGGAPQFAAFMLEETDYARELQYGKTLVSSVLSPVPRLGRPFRSSSGVNIYNRLIYGSDTVDQVLPFQAELFLNFDLPAVILGYLLLGWAVQRLQREFVRAPTLLQRFAWQYVATWVGFLVIGTLSVLSQVSIYLFLPLYVLATWAYLMRNPHWVNSPYSSLMSAIKRPTE